MTGRVCLPRQPKLHTSRGWRGRPRRRFTATHHVREHCDVERSDCAKKEMTVVELIQPVRFRSSRRRTAPNGQQRSPRCRVPRWAPRATGPVRISPLLAHEASMHKIVFGLTRRWQRSARGSRRIRPANTARSAQSRCGLGLVRRSTATSCRSTSNSMSFVEDGRRSSTTSLSTCRKSRCSSRSGVATIMPDHRRPITAAQQRVRRIGTPHPPMVSLWTTLASAGRGWRSCRPTPSSFDPTSPSTEPPVGARTSPPWLTGTGWSMSQAAARSGCHSEAAVAGVVGG